MQTLTITITSETWDFSDSLSEVTRHVTSGWLWGKDENDTESYEYIVKNIYSSQKILNQVQNDASITTPSLNT